MATLLLLTIYIGFIGLGVPDSLLGSAWPSMFAELNLPVSFNGVIGLFINVCTMLSSIFSARVIRRFGTGRVTATSTVLTALGLLGFSLTKSIWLLFACCVPLGMGAGAVDAGLNNYVALHYKAIHLNFLHCFYGVGVSISPVLMSLALGGGASFRRGYFFAFLLQAVIALISLLSLPLWSRVKHPHALLTNDADTRIVPLKTQLSTPGVKIMWLMFFFGCAIEWTGGSWCGTFVFAAKGLSEASAAACVSLYYAGLAVGRFLSGLLSERLSEKRLIFIGLCTVGAASLLEWLPSPVAVIALFFAGLGIGPIYPNLVHLTPRLFGAENSQSIMGTEMAFAYLGIMFTPLVFGSLIDLIGLWIFPSFIGFLLIPTALCAEKMRTYPLKNERNETT